jgi:hypothetical protein
MPDLEMPSVDEPDSVMLRHAAYSVKEGPRTEFLESAILLEIPDLEMLIVEEANSIMLRHAADSVKMVQKSTHTYTEMSFGATNQLRSKLYWREQNFREDI